MRFYHTSTKYEYLSCVSSNLGRLCEWVQIGIFQLDFLSTNIALELICFEHSIGSWIAWGYISHGGLNGYMRSALINALQASVNGLSVSFYEWGVLIGYSRYWIWDIMPIIFIFNSPYKIFSIYNIMLRRIISL